MVKDDTQGMSVFNRVSVWRLSLLVEHMPSGSRDEPPTLISDDKGII